MFCHWTFYVSFTILHMIFFKIFLLICHWNFFVSFAVIFLCTYQISVNSFKTISVFLSSSMSNYTFVSSILPPYLSHSHFQVVWIRLDPWFSVTKFRVHLYFSGATENILQSVATYVRTWFRPSLAYLPSRSYLAGSQYPRRNVHLDGHKWFHQQWKSR